MPLPAPSPELYERAAALAGTCGWAPGVLEGKCDPKKPDRSKPCCANGHLMLAAGREPSYYLYENVDYERIVRPVLDTIMGSEKFLLGANCRDIGRKLTPFELLDDRRNDRIVHKALLERNYRPAASALQHWNDGRLRFDAGNGDGMYEGEANDSAAALEREIFLETARRLREFSEDGDALAAAEDATWD